MLLGNSYLSKASLSFKFYGSPYVTKPDHQVSIQRVDNRIIAGKRLDPSWKRECLRPVRRSLTGSGALPGLTACGK